MGSDGDRGAADRFMLPAPTRRPLKIFAFDPMRGRELGNRASIDIGYEPLEPGPSGRRIRVVDWDASADRYHPAVDLDDPRILIRGGLDADESDPRFHQQMVYGVAMKTVELFERALGRRLSLWKSKRRSGESVRAPLLILPHAFHGANAYYDPGSHALLFGYFRADLSDPGPNLPGQWVFTCLSHDIVVHETAHALLHRLRKHFLEATNPDVLALHEGFADIVAVFQHFTYRDVVAEAIRRAPREFNARSGLATLAEQFGYTRGKGRALRTAYVGPEVRLVDVGEPHERGGVLVAAVFDAYFELFERRTHDLIRVATAGTGQLAPGEAPADLAAMLAAIAASTAQQLLSMCIRAVEYLPPVDPTFGDYLRALVTADTMLAPVDDDGRRGVLVAAFRRRGILPDGVGSLAEESLILAVPEGDLRFDAAGLAAFATLMQEAAAGTDADTEDPGGDDDGHAAADAGSARGEMAARLVEFAQGHRAQLSLGPGPVQVGGIHACFRAAQDGQLVVELIAQLVQSDRSPDPSLAGLTYRGGTTIVIGGNGVIRAVAPKPMDGPPAAPSAAPARPRLDRMRQFVTSLDARDPAAPYRSPEAQRVRMRARSSLAALHGSR